MRHGALAEEHQDYSKPKKVTRAIDRNSTTGLFLLRAAQIGLSMADLDLISVGTVYDMIIEHQNDDYEYAVIGTAEDLLRI